MNKNLVVKILRKKTHHFLTISMVIMVVSLITFNFMFSYLVNQYQTINKDYITNNNVKVMHVNSKADDSRSSSIKIGDEKNINDLLSANGLADKAKSYPIYTLPSIFDSSMDTRFSLMGLSEELAFLISDSCTLKDNSICLNEYSNENIDLKIPVIEEKDGGYSSSTTIDVTYTAEEGAKSENAISIHSIPNNNQAFVNEKETHNLLKSMFQSSTDSFDFILNTQLDKIIVYVKDINDVDTVGELLKENQYHTSYTFSSFENFSANISSTQVVLLILSIVFVITSIITAVLLMINFLRVQRKDIAILKLNGYDNLTIISIFTKLIFVTLQKIFIISFFIYLVNYIFKLVPVTFTYFLIIIGVDILMLLLTLACVYFLGIKKVCSTNMMDLIKKGKEFE